MFDFCCFLFLLHSHSSINVEHINKQKPLSHCFLIEYQESLFGKCCVFIMTLQTYGDPIRISNVLQFRNRIANIVVRRKRKKPANKSQNLNDLIAIIYIHIIMLMHRYVCSPMRTICVHNILLMPLLERHEKREKVKKVECMRDRALLIVYPDDLYPLNFIAYHFLFGSFIT